MTHPTNGGNGEGVDEPSAQGSWFAKPEHGRTLGVSEAGWPAVPPARTGATPPRGPGGGPVLTDAVATGGVAAEATARFPEVLQRAEATSPLPEAEGPPPEAAPAPKKPGRDRYLDLLRSVALVRVIAYHLFGWVWLSVVFPSMGVMFALAGSLMARSLSRPALSVVRGRLRRLLPPMWLFSALVLPLLFIGGWNPGKDPDTGGGAWGWLGIVNYVIPIGAPAYPWEIANPPGFLETTWAEQGIGPLWYLRAYMWFVLASPLLLKAFRKLPWATLCAPLALTAVIGTGLVEIPGRTGEAVTDFAVYGSCWVLGFAHQEGVLQKVPRYAAVSGAALLMGFGLWWASGHLSEEGWDLNEIPLAQATWSLGFVVILLQYAPSWQQLPGRLARWDRLVTLANNRAVTIYLWHNLLIMATFPLIDLLYELPFMDDKLSSALDSTYMLWSFVLIWPLIGLAIVATGWVEDLAAKRKPRLWPDGRRSGGSGSRRK
ncbi:MULTISPECIES: acyltransferase family protein [unclassified Streptomyces]|uniref:acyltransferase family protein n=1 Tax=unclassified Streptomyces TaxID=2593676 RepID=UPI002257FEA2|nr:MULTISPECIES: acyltransferase [unclassified Streptomyces]MCX4827348.1 acyltransferase [Streptomyces sp. NBC_01016]